MLWQKDKSENVYEVNHVYLFEKWSKKQLVKKGIIILKGRTNKIVKFKNKNKYKKI